MSASEPIYPRPALGYRMWIFSGGFLHSLGQFGCVWRAGDNLAYCARSAPGGALQAAHDAPAAHCHCGWNAWNSLDDVITNAPSPVSVSGRGATPNRPLSSCFIIGAILGAGSLQLHSDGWRSERGQVLALLEHDELTDHERREITSRYSVPLVADGEELLELTEAYEPPPARARPKPAEPVERPAAQPRRVPGTLKTAPAPTGWPGGVSLQKTTRASRWHRAAHNTPLSIEPGDSRFSMAVSAITLLVLLLSAAYLVGLIVPSQLRAIYIGTLAALLPTAYLYALFARPITERLELDRVTVIEAKERPRDLAERADSSWRNKSWPHLRKQASFPYLAAAAAYRWSGGIQIFWAVLLSGTLGAALSGIATGVGCAVAIWMLALMTHREADTALSWLTRCGLESKRGAGPTSRGKKLTGNQELVRSVTAVSSSAALAGEPICLRRALAYAWDSALVVISACYVTGALITDPGMALAGVPSLVLGVLMLIAWSPMSRLAVISELPKW